VGQKRHPLGLRSGVTQERKSAWHADFNQRANVSEEHDEFRAHVCAIAKANSIANVKTFQNDQIESNVETGKPGASVGDSGVRLETSSTMLKNCHQSVVMPQSMFLRIILLIQLLHNWKNALLSEELRGKRCKVLKNRVQMEQKFKFKDVQMELKWQEASGFKKIKFLCKRCMQTLIMQQKKPTLPVVLQKSNFGCS
jgi:hypothetical protein